MDRDRTLPSDHAPLNREQRRAARFRPKASRQPSPWDRVTAPPTDDTAGEHGDDEAVTRGASGDVTRLTGPGTGGASEGDGRKPHHEGAHVGNPADR